MDLRNLLRRKKKELTPVTGEETATTNAMDPPAGTDSDVPVVRPSKPARNQPIELGTIEYCNLTPDGRHGDFDAAIREAAATGKPIFANFVEWSG
jgi:hypothetical protein